MNTPSGWTTTEGVSDRSADWQRILDSGTYPYANFHLAKLTLEMPHFDGNQTHQLPSLLAACDSVESPYNSSQPDDRCLRIESS